MIFNMRGKRKVYFDYNKTCLRCEKRVSQALCGACLGRMSEALYEDLKRLNPKADKVLVFPSSIYNRKIGSFIVVDLCPRVLNSLCYHTQHGNLKIYKNGQKISAILQTAENPAGEILEMRPRQGRFGATNGDLAEVWRNEYLRRQMTY